MDNGTYQGSYALITSDILQNTFSTLSQNGLGLQTFAYFSGIPWEDSPSIGVNPKVADAIVLSYVTDNNQFTVDTVNYYNNYDSTNNQVCSFKGECYKIGNQNIGINVGGDTYLPLNFPIFMYEYGWTPSNSFPPSSGPGVSSGYYVGILQYNDSIGYFLTTQYTNNPNPSGYYDYYYSGSAYGGSNYYFLEDNNGNIQGYSGPYCSKNNQFCDIFAPTDQQNNLNYSQYGVFWLYNWFQVKNNAENNNMNIMNIYFLMNGNIFNYSLASEQYSWECDCGLFGCSTCSAYAIPPNPPASTNTITGEPIFAQSYINAYNTAFNQETARFTENYQKALDYYNEFTYNDVNSNFIPGTFGYDEVYNGQNDQLGNSITINALQDDASVYGGNPYLFVSAGSGGGSGYMYLDWVIVTYGVPYVASVS